MSNHLSSGRRGGGAIIWEGANIPFAPLPQQSTHIFLLEKNHKYTKLKGKIIINETLIWFEGTGKTIPFNSILEFSIWSDFKMRNVIIWHWLNKNLVGTWRQYDVMCLRGIWHPLAPTPLQYSKPSYAYVVSVSWPRSSSYFPKTAWIFLRLSSLVTWSFN